MPNRNFLARMSFENLKSPKNEHLMVTGETGRIEKQGEREKRPHVYKVLSLNNLKRGRRWGDGKW